MNQYEVTFIVDPVLSGDEIKSTAQTYVKAIEKAGGEIVHFDEMGLRQLAYPINKRTSGIYFCIEFKTATGEMIANIGKAKFETFPDTGELMIEWLRFAYNRMVANLEIYAELEQSDPMKAADAAAKTGKDKARGIDPKLAEEQLRKMKEQEWREALLVRGTYLFPRK